MLRRRVVDDNSHSPLYNSGSEWSGSVLFDFLGRLLVVIGFIAPPVAILAVVAYYAMNP